MIQTAKEPWEMTKAELMSEWFRLREEISRAKTRHLDWQWSRPKDVPGRTEDEKRLAFNVELSARRRTLEAVQDKATYYEPLKHARRIREALAEGKPVPAKVLREYESEPWANLAKMEEPEATNI